MRERPETPIAAPATLAAKHDVRKLAGLHGPPRPTTVLFEVLDKRPQVRIGQRDARQRGHRGRNVTIATAAPGTGIALDGLPSRPLALAAC